MRLMFRKRAPEMWRAQITDREAAYVAHLRGEWHAFILISMNPGLRKHPLGTFDTQLEAKREAAAYAERKLS